MRFSIHTLVKGALITAGALGALLVSVAPADATPARLGRVFAALEPQAAPTASGLTIAVDPATGKLRQPTAAEAQLLAQSLRQQLGSGAESLQMTQAADGTITVFLGADHLNVSLAHENGAGHLHANCITDIDNAAAALANPAPQVLEEQ